MSERAQKVLTWIKNQNSEAFFIRQQSLAELFGCSRRSIGRALKELKEAGLLVDLNKRHENRCKVYRHCEEPQAEGVAATRQSMDCFAPLAMTTEAQLQWERYSKTFAIVFKTPDLKDHYAQVTWELAGIKDEGELWSKTWAGLWAQQGQI